MENTDKGMTPEKGIIHSSEKGLSISWDSFAPVEVELGPDTDFCPDSRGMPKAAGTFATQKSGPSAAGKVCPQKLPLCKYCSCDATFVHDGLDPIYRKGIWERHKLDNVCVKKMSIEEQNNKGKWMLCDVNHMDKCHFYEPGN